MAAYIDLNCVRAGLVHDPKDYRFCGYAEAVAGDPRARSGLLGVTATKSWDEAQAGYRQLLFSTGAEPREQAAVIPLAEVQRVLKEGGQLPLATVLRCRIRYFSDGAVLGTQAFVKAQLDRYQDQTGLRKHTDPHALPAVAPGLGDLATLRGLRRRVFG